MAKKDITVRFKYRDVFGTHGWKHMAQSTMMKVLRNTAVTWVAVQNIETGEYKQCTDGDLKHWTKVPDAVAHWFDDEPRGKYWDDPEDPGYKYPKPIQRGYNEAFDGSIVDVFTGKLDY